MTKLLNLCPNIAKTIIKLIFFNLKLKNSILQDRKFKRFKLLDASLISFDETVSHRCLFCLKSEFSNLKPREYVPRYNPLRLFHVAASELSKPCQTFVAVCFYLSTDRDIPRKVPVLGEKSCGKPQDISSPCDADIHRIHLFSSNSPSIYVTTSF